MMKGIIGSAALTIAAAVAATIADDRPHEVAPSRQPRTKPRAKAAGHGVKLAADRLKAHREAQDQRLANAPDAMPTRQQRRQAERRADKMPLGMKQSEWHEARGLPKIRPSKRRRAVK